MPTRGTFALLLALLAPASGLGQVRYPAPPERYDAHIRYRIRGDGNARIVQFRQMQAFLKSAGFVPAEREDADLDIFDPAAERLVGTVSSANAFRLLDDSRVRQLLLLPAGTAVGDDPGKLVPVRITLAAGLDPREQQRLHGQAVAHLRRLGFRELTAYDGRRYTTVRGSLPAGNLFALLKDVRDQPGGWFAPAVPLDALPAPLRNVLPVRAVEVLPAVAETPAVPPPPTATDPAALKLTDDLRAVLDDPARQGLPLRAEVVFDSEPLAGFRDLDVLVRQTAGGALADGLVGTVGSVRLLRADDVLRFARLPEVRAVRLPRAAEDTAVAVPETTPGGVRLDALLASTKVGDLHRLGYTGGGVRVAVIAAGFPGVTDLFGNRLPKDTRVLDLTAELSPTLEPLPAAAGADAAGGTAVALAAHAAAPDADLTLVRVDPGAIHQLLTVARAALGEGGFSPALQARTAELSRQEGDLAARRDRVNKEYTDAFNDLSDEPASAARREAAARDRDRLYADERALRGTQGRLVALRAKLERLAGTPVVINTLVWEGGYPHDGLSDLSRFLDERLTTPPTRSVVRAARRGTTFRPVWVQAASAATDRVWAGPFLDADGNGVMEFAPETAGIPAGRYSRELNFLRFEPAAGGTATGTLPAGFRFRVTVQWREPVDAGAAGQVPAFPLVPHLLRQLDPEGKTVASDELVDAARPLAPPVKLLRTAGGVTWEQTLDVLIPADGSYALRIVGARANDAVSLDPREGAELSPRIVLDTPDPAAAAKGRVVFETYPVVAGGVGIPGDAPTAVTVGTGGPPAGAGPGVTLRVKPDLVTAGTVVADGRAGTGPGVAAGFAGGAAASLLSAGVRASDLVRSAEASAGRPLVVPQELLTNLVERRNRLPGDGR